MSNKDIYVVIMAGGVGSRFWPYSRNSYPKQFLDVLGSGYSLLQMTFERFRPLCPVENFYVVTNEDYASLVKKQLPEIAAEQILEESQRRNTAPCIAYASYKIGKLNPDARIVVTPSDHAIFKEKEFVDTIELALKDLESNPERLITLGIQPNRPDTGYGYIQYFKDEFQPVKKVKTFTEKPELELAKTFLESGDFVWNAGIFVWRAREIKRAFQHFLPDIAEEFEEASEFFYTDNEQAAIEKAYSLCKSISIDYGILEKSGHVYVVLGNFGWSDLGSWNSLHSVKEKNEDNNVVDANALVYNSSNCIIVSHDKDKLFIVEGLENYLVADFDDVILVCNKDNEKKFREFVSDVRSQKGEHFL
ncbi:MAG: mannose-1-phosphate guanylyltransferase [Cytophagales bacterium]|nr:mannose-1-phosphate guanylyltransferase [Cytophagales bacterium]